MAATLEGETDAWVTLHIETGDRERTDEIFETLKKHREQIEKCIEGDWHWHRLPQSHSSSSINLKKDGCSIDDPPEKHDEIRAWMIENLRRLKEIMDPRLERILKEDTQDR